MGKVTLIPYIKSISGDLETPVTLYSKYVGESRGFPIGKCRNAQGKIFLHGQRSVFNNQIKKR